MPRVALQTKTSLTLAGAILLFATTATAAQTHEAAVVSVAGEWEITMQNDVDSYVWNVTFEQEGQVLSGFAETMGQVFPLEGWIDGQEITFNVTVDLPDHEAPLSFVGKVEGHSASGVMDPTDGVHAGALMDWYAERKDG